MVSHRLPRLATVSLFLRRLFLFASYTSLQFVTTEDIPFVFSLLSLFSKIKVGLWDHVAVCVYPPIVARQQLGKKKSPYHC
jgi:hypothetical protein